MPVRLNHTIVHAADRDATTAFLVEILGLPEPTSFGPFLVVECANDVSLDVIYDPDPFDPQHYAFLVSEEEFDAIFDRIKTRDLPHWADPSHLPRAERVQPQRRRSRRVLERPQRP